MPEQTNTTPAAPARVIFIRSPRQMSEAQLRAALASRDEDDPLMQAVHQILDRALASAVYDSSDPQLDATKGTYPGGRVAALSELKSELVAYRVAPVKKAAPAAAKAKTRARR